MTVSEEARRDGATGGFVSGFVGIVGRPNVGKSTLTNLLVGRKIAIVSDIPQTTRNRIHGVRNLPGGQIVVVDTPGIHRPQHAMNRRMVAVATAALREVDVLLFMIEADGGPAGTRDDLGPGDRFIVSRLPEDGPPVLLVVNKIDRIRKDRLLPFIERIKDRFPFREILLISALTGENAADLPDKLLRYLPAGPPLYPDAYVTDQQERFRVAEIIREKLLHHTREEIPHETCVLIEVFDEAESGFMRIEATILVEKESQRKIVIGRDGALLKTVGTEARAEIESLLAARVFLGLWVKVREGWREDESILRLLGLRGDV